MKMQKRLVYILFSLTQKIAAVRLRLFSFLWSPFHGHLFEWSLLPDRFRLRPGKITQALSPAVIAPEADDGVPTGLALCRINLNSQQTIYPVPDAACGVHPVS